MTSGTTNSDAGPGRQAEDPGRNQPNPKSKSSPWSTVFTYGFSLACLIALFWLAGQGALDQLREPSWLWLGAVILATLAFTAAAAMRYDSLLDYLGVSERPGFLSLLHATSFGMTAGLFVTSSLGQVVGKPGMLRSQAGMDMGKGVYASLAERLLDLALGLVLLIPILIKLAMPQEPFAGFHLSVFFAVAATWCALAAWRLGLLLNWFHRLLNWLLGLAAKIPFMPRAKLQRMAKQGSWQELATPNQEHRPLAPAAWTVARTLAMSARLYFLVLAFGLPISWEALLLGAPIVIVSMIISFTPGSLGFMDAGWLAVLTLQGVPVETTLTFLVALRVTNYIFLPLITLALKAASRRQAGGEPPLP